MFEQVSLSSEDYGKHFTGVEDLLQKHMLVEADIQGQADRVKQAIDAADAFLDTSPSEDGELVQFAFPDTKVRSVVITLTVQRHLVLLEPLYTQYRSS